MAVDTKDLTSAQLKRLKTKIEKQLAAAKTIPVASINSRDEVIVKLAKEIKAIAKDKGIANEQVVEALVKRFRLKLAAPRSAE